MNINPNIPTNSGTLGPIQSTRVQAQQQVSKETIQRSQLNTKTENPFLVEAENIKQILFSVIDKLRGLFDPTVKWEKSIEQIDQMVDISRGDPNALFVDEGVLNDTIAKFDLIANSIKTSSLGEKDKAKFIGKLNSKVELFTNRIKERCILIAQGLIDKKFSPNIKDAKAIKGVQDEMSKIFSDLFKTEHIGKSDYVGLKGNVKSGVQKANIMLIELAKMQGAPFKLQPFVEAMRTLSVNLDQYNKPPAFEETKFSKLEALINSSQIDYLSISDARKLLTMLKNSQAELDTSIDKNKFEFREISKKYENLHTQLYEIQINKVLKQVSDISYLAELPLNSTEVERFKDIIEKLEINTHELGNNISEDFAEILNVLRDKIDGQLVNDDTSIQQRKIKFFEGEISQVTSAPAKNKQEATNLYNRLLGMLNVLNLVELDSSKKKLLQGTLIGLCQVLESKFFQVEHQRLRDVNPKNMEQQVLARHEIKNNALVDTSRMSERKDPRISRAMQDINQAREIPLRQGQELITSSIKIIRQFLSNSEVSEFKGRTLLKTLNGLAQNVEKNKLNYTQSEEFSKAITSLKAEVQQRMVKDSSKIAYDTFMSEIKNPLFNKSIEYYNELMTQHKQPLALVHEFNKLALTFFDVCRTKDSLAIANSLTYIYDLKIPEDAKKYIINLKDQLEDPKSIKWILESKINDILKSSHLKVGTKADYLNIVLEDVQNNKFLDSATKKVLSEKLSNEIAKLKNIQGSGTTETKPLESHTFKTIDVTSPSGVSQKTHDEQVITEMYNTEVTFHKQLNNLKSVLNEALKDKRESFEKLNLSDQDKKFVGEYIKSISEMEIGHNALLKKLNQLATKNLSLSDFLKDVKPAYEEYLNQLSVLANLSQKSIFLNLGSRMKLSTKFTIEVLGKLDFESLNITSVQRAPRWIMLFGELLKKMPENEKLNELLDLTKTKTNEINQNIRLEEQVQAEINEYIENTNEFNQKTLEELPKKIKKFMSELRVLINDDIMYKSVELKYNLNALNKLFNKLEPLSKKDAVRHEVSHILSQLGFFDKNRTPEIFQIYNSWSDDDKKSFRHFIRIVAKELENSIDNLDALNEMDVKDVKNKLDVILSVFPQALAESEQVKDLLPKLLASRKVLDSSPIKIVNPDVAKEMFIALNKNSNRENIRNSAEDFLNFAGVFDDPAGIDNAFFKEFSKWDGNAKASLENFIRIAAKDYYDSGLQAFGKKPAEQRRIYNILVGMSKLYPNALKSLPNIASYIAEYRDILKNSIQ